MMNRWSFYPDLVKALHARDWATLTALYRAGAPGSALFPGNVGLTSLDLEHTVPRPDDGILNLPAALVYTQGMYQNETVYEQTLSPDVWDDATDHALHELMQAWQHAGGVWDDVSVLSQNATEDRPHWFRSLSLLAAEHMTPEQPDSWHLVHFEADVQPWLEKFLTWGWSPWPVAGVPMVHRAVQCGRLMWAQALLDHQDADDPWSQAPRDRLDNTPLHALAVAAPHAWNDEDRRQERLDWLREWPLSAWQTINANGHTPLEHGLLALDLDLVDDFLVVADEQTWALPLADSVRQQALQQASEPSNQQHKGRLLELLRRWEAQQLQGALPEATTSIVRRPHRL